MRLSRHLLVAPLIGVSVAVGACDSTGIPMTATPTREVPPDVFETVPQGQLPSYLEGYDPQVLEAYRFSADHYEELRWIPCYCGCVALGHRHNAGCAIQGVNPDGTITFTSHAAECPICLATTREAMRLYSEGKSLTEIRDAIDSQFGSVGPGTHTPYPR